jgi:phenylpyruvate tautomerase PptA (4-oxalocrotonate tautomerase family)
LTIMRVGLVGTSLTDQQKEMMAKRRIDVFAKVEVGHAEPAVKNGFLVQFEELGRTDLWMGERPMADSSSSGKAAVVSAHVMAGPWNPEMKRDLFAGIEAVVRDVADMPKEGAGADFWMTFVEVPEGSWGLGGRPVSIKSLLPVFAQDRQERIRKYLAGGED